MPPAGKTADSRQELVSRMLQVMDAIRCMVVKASAAMKGSLMQVYSTAAAKSSEDAPETGKRPRQLSLHSG